MGRPPRIREGVDLCGQPSSPSGPYNERGRFFYVRGMLMNAHHGTVDHLDVAVISLGDGVHDAVPKPRLCASERTDCSRWCRGRSVPAVPSIYSIVPPHDGSAFRHGHHFEPVEFEIDHRRGHHDAYSTGSCQRTYAGACGCRQRPRRHREKLIETERGWSGREAFVTMMQTADFGQGNNLSGPGRLNGSSIRCVLAERQVCP